MYTVEPFEIDRFARYIYNKRLTLVNGGSYNG